MELPPTLYIKKHKKKKRENEIEQIVALFLGDGIAPNPIYQET